MASHHHKEADIINSLLLSSIISNLHMVDLRLMLTTTPTSNHNKDMDNHRPARRRGSTAHPLHSPMVLRLIPHHPGRMVLLLPRAPRITRPGLRRPVTAHHRLTVTDSLPVRPLSNPMVPYRPHPQRTRPSPTPCSTRRHHLRPGMALQ